MEDRPRSLRDDAVLQDRLGRLEEPHVAPLNAWVLDLRGRLGPSAIVPWFDPADGGQSAAAQAAWRHHRPATRDLRVFACPHPSPTNVNTRPGARPYIVDAWRQAHAAVR